MNKDRKRDADASLFLSQKSDPIPPIIAGNFCGGGAVENFKDTLSAGAYESI